MTVRVGINGFGRMGRLGVRAGWEMDELSIVQVNEIATDAAGSAHLLKFDSVHGIWGLDCEGEGDAMSVGGKQIAYSRNLLHSLGRPVRSLDGSRVIGDAFMPADLEAVVL